MKVLLKFDEVNIIILSHYIVTEVEHLEYVQKWIMYPLLMVSFPNAFLKIVS